MIKIQYPNISLIDFFKSRNNLNQESVMLTDIYSCFRVAKRIVSKVEEIEQPNRKVVLVADDEPLTFELINEFFKDANLSYKILKAETGRRAYRIAVSEI
ncbi:MAG: hypothetical protein HY015_10305, partial [Bacteroidetes bacterium]|nr:hypothetical protein [Bacteroidota bacterium]